VGPGRRTAGTGLANRLEITEQRLRPALSDLGVANGLEFTEERSQPVLSELGGWTARDLHRGARERPEVGSGDG